MNRVESDEELQQRIERRMATIGTQVYIYNDIAANSTAVYSYDGLHWYVILQMKKYAKGEIEKHTQITITEYFPGSPSS